jgi:uncharacterized protein (DUF2236 family)
MVLHDDSASVSEALLERQLELVRAAAAGPLAGVFGPASMMWRIEREAAPFLCAGRALLLQLAHPWVAAAIVEHSRVLDQPMVRFQHTFRIVFALVFGTLDQAFAAARALHRRHASATGTLPETVGPLPGGSRYCANNITALRWVYATLIDSALMAHDLTLAPVSGDERERYYAESRLFAALFGIPRSFLPEDWAAFAAYNEAMWHSPLLTVSPAARALAEKILSGAGTGTAVPEGYRALTIGMLPTRLRRDFGLSYGDPERRASDRALGWARRIYPLLPTRLRYVGPYHEAQARLSGSRGPDLATQVLNRFWIGRESLSD